MRSTVNGKETGGGDRVSDSIRLQTESPLDDTPESSSLRALSSFDAFAGHMRRFDDLERVPLELLEDLIIA